MHCHVAEIDSLQKGHGNFNVQEVKEMAGKYETRLNRFYG